MHRVLSAFERTSLRALLVVLLLLFALPALAALNDPLARDLKQKGDSAMVEGNYAEALDSYEKATAIEANPSLLYNRARALSALDRYVEALEMYEAFERAAPPEMRALVPQLDDLIEKTRQKVTFVTFVLPAGDCRVYVRGDEVLAPRDGEKRFLSGEAKVRVVVAGYEPFERTLGFEGGKDLKVEPVLVALTKTGTLHVTSKVPGAEVLVDGQSVGMVPVDVTLEPGSHEVLLRHPKYRTVKTSSLVVRGKATHVAVDMDKKPTLAQRWWFWTGVGTVVAAAVTVSIVATTEKKPGSGDIPPGTITVPGK